MANSRVDLPQPELADDAQELSGMDGQADPIHRTDLRVIGQVRDGEVVDFKQWFWHVAFSPAGARDCRSRQRRS